MILPAVSDIERNTFHVIVEHSPGVPAATDKECDEAFEMADHTLASLRRLEPAIPERRGLLRIELAGVWHAQLSAVRQSYQEALRGGGRRLGGRLRRKDPQDLLIKPNLRIVDDSE